MSVSRPHPAAFVAGNDAPRVGERAGMKRCYLFERQLYDHHFALFSTRVSYRCAASSGSSVGAGTPDRLM
jgi:hypothetical protein